MPHDLGVEAVAPWFSATANLTALIAHSGEMPDGVEIVVLLPGWPPTREALNAWNLVGGPLRVILVVDGPPADRALIGELNRMRPLERIIAQMEHPSRSGFERLQRPLQRLLRLGVRTRPGRLAGEFLIGYALVRAFGEQFREPDAWVSLILGLTRGTFYSIFLFVAGLILWLRRPAAPVSE